MKSAEPLHTLPPGAHIWPLSVSAYRVLGEAGLISKRTELLNGVVYQKMSKSPLHSALVRELLTLLAQAQLTGCFVSSEQPITCGDYSEPEPDVLVLALREDHHGKRHLDASHTMATHRRGESIAPLAFPDVMPKVDEILG